ncbi:MAG: hypothetical protein PHV37_05300 [Candidatus Gastranaerophilales bacterium]|nr:hypothetical protein [Candidatus Gastranaerophilales bacterium]
MIKINALDLLERDIFEVEIFSENGDLIHAANERVTPENLLRLYFTDIYVKQSLSDKDKAFLTEKNSVPSVYMSFDEEEAKAVAKYSIYMGELLHFSRLKLKELEQAAYNYNIGVKKIKISDKDNDDFMHLKGEYGYKYLLQELKLPDKVAEVARLYNKDYNCNDFSIANNKLENIPYYHIVAIADYYFNYFRKSNSKEKTIQKMIRIGGKKFNIYILHKFLNKMKDIND